MAALAAMRPSACDPDEPVIGSDLGLYSVTFNNEVRHGPTKEALG